MDTNEPAHPPQRCTQILDHFGWQRHTLPLDDSGYRAEINSRPTWLNNLATVSLTVNDLRSNSSDLLRHSLIRSA